MQQLTQKLGSGDMQIQEIPYPQLGRGMIMVRNHFSIISPGTEGSTVQTARKNLIAKAKERPNQVRQVVETLKKQGPVATYRAVMKKLDSYTPLGYSCSGEIIELGEGVTSFKVGDKVACAGVGYANHAEVVCVPINLCVKLDDNVNLRDAAYNTLGAIAMQGVRQADNRLGESCVVIGLGLLGQLTALLLKASGVKVIGVDISEDVVKKTKLFKVCEHVFTRSDLSLKEKIISLTNGLGADSIIISAGTKSLDPINFAGSIARKKAKVVALGVIPTGFDRDPYWYRKELTLEMSCSYGPGRYDLNYEEKGIDYPASYVRWTQNRNMVAFQELIRKKQIDISYMTTHEFPFNDAAKAFDLIINKKEPFIGIALKYDIHNTNRKSKIFTENKNKKPSSKINVSFIGAGSYAQGNLLPFIPNNSKINKIGVLTNTGTTSKRVAEKFNFEFCSSKEQDILDSNTNTVFIATRHDSHAKYVLKSLKANKNVFVEKPLCLLESELNEIIKIKEKSKVALMIGFNRRFSPLTKKIKNIFDTGPMSMIYRINAGNISSDNWLQDIEIGGGRIIGEVCHFIDYLTYINGSLPVSISANCMDDNEGLNDTVNIIMKFENGSTGTVCYYSNGSKSLSKELIEIYSHGITAIIDDFKELKIFGKGKPKKTKLLNQNKGQKEMVISYFENIIESGDSPISFAEVVSVTRACFKIIESIKNNGELIYL